jgi:hypothetical protein
MANVVQRQHPGSTTMSAESNDLYNWRLDPTPAIDGGAHEGPKVFSSASGTGC